MSKVRTRDDFDVRALGEADIARRELGLEADEIDWDQVVLLARGKREQGSTTRGIDWKEIVESAHVRNHYTNDIIQLTKVMKPERQ